jgi:nicotinate-nucleotide pyrophosphorylase (carboxylating)
VAIPVFDIGHPEVRSAVQRALEEDIGAGDVTSELTVPADLQASGSFLAKQPFVLAGIELLPLIYEAYGTVDVQILKDSGSNIQPAELLATVSGPARALLTCERVALNFLQRLSGVAPLAHPYVEAVAGTTNHRHGLYDAILIKNNHITAAGGVRNALTKTRDFPGPVEIEVRSRAELDEALVCGAEHLLLDNLSPSDACEWIRYIDGRATTELSGNITLDNIRGYAATGPDFISCGAITHSATAVDISFRLELK